MFKTFIVLLAVLCGQAKDSTVSKEEAPPAGVPKQEELDQEMRKLPWDEMEKTQQDAVAQMFDRNGWNSEEDQFARELFLKVGAVPPWEPAQRQAVFLEGLTERYGLSVDQKREFSRLMQREAMRMTVNHFTEVAPIAMEVIKTRTAGEPFTAEQVARWTTVLRPIAEEARESVERISRDLSKGMSEKQRAQLQRDMKSLIRRHRTVTAQMVKWEQGEWKAEDWGLGRDPVQTGQKKAGDSGAAVVALDVAVQRHEAKPLPQPPGAVIMKTEHEWERYVREVAAKHKFSETQRKSAQGILQELLGRAKDWRATNNRRIEDLRGRIAKTADANAKARLTAELNSAEAPIQKMFEELQKRVDALLTAEQRRAAGI